MSPDDFDIYEIPVTPPHHLDDRGWYTIQGFSDRGAGYRLVKDANGSTLTYYRPDTWTDDDWEEFCDEMEEDICGDDTVSMGQD